VSALPDVVTDILNNITNDKANTLCVISGREKSLMKSKYGHIRNIYIAAENGYYYAWNDKHQECVFNRFMNVKDWGWKEVVLDIIKSYKERIDGSFIEVKDSSIRWFYKGVDTDFGIKESNELVTDLQNFLRYLPLEIVHEKDYVEVRLIGADKESFTKEFLNAYEKNKGKADFILCIGDSQSDEGIFKVAKEYAKKKSLKNVFCMTVGEKMSLADYYMNNSSEVAPNLAEIILPSVEVSFLYATSYWKDNLKVLQHQKDLEDEFLLHQTLARLSSKLLISLNRSN
jgi:trehalose 6-phosphate synthase/phosphatase